MKKPTIMQKKLKPFSKEENGSMEDRRNEIILTGMIEMQNELGYSFFDFLTEQEQEELLELDKKLGYVEFLKKKKDDEKNIEDELVEDEVEDLTSDKYNKAYQDAEKEKFEKGEDYFDE